MRDGQGDHDPGRGIECRQVAAGGGAGARARRSRAFRRALQAAEHVQQRRRHRRWRRDRPRSGAAGARRAAGAGQRHEPGAPQARDRYRRAGDRAGAAHRHLARARLCPPQARASGSRAGELRAALRGRRYRAGRGRRQPGGDQPARRRHRQYGLCRSRRRAGHPRGRYRPWRGDRADRRHAGGACPLRCRTDPGLCHQQVSWRCAALRRGPGRDRAAHRLALAGGAAVVRRSLASACGGRDGYPEPPRRQAQGGGAKAGADRQFRRSRSAIGRTRSERRDHRTRPPAAGRCQSGADPREQGDDRRSG